MSSKPSTVALSLVDDGGAARSDVVIGGLLAEWRGTPDPCAGGPAGRRRTPGRGAGVLLVGEGPHRAAQLGGHAGELVDGGAGVGQRLGGRVRGGGDPGDVVRDLPGAT